MTRTTFVYTRGKERSVIIALINYPRYPAESEAIRKHAFVLAEWLKAALGQIRVSVVFPDITIMLGDA